MWLLRLLARWFGGPVTELPEAQYRGLVEVALLAQRAGVRPTLSEWRALEPIEQRAWLAAAAVAQVTDPTRAAIAAARAAGDAVTLRDLADTEEERVLLACAERRAHASGES